jgi:hypothetical protein
MDRQFPDSIVCRISIIWTPETAICALFKCCCMDEIHFESVIMNVLLAQMTNVVLYYETTSTSSLLKRPWKLPP